MRFVIGSLLIAGILSGCGWVDKTGKQEDHVTIVKPEDQVSYGLDDDETSTVSGEDASTEAFSDDEQDAVSAADRGVVIDGYRMADICTARNTNTLITGSQSQVYGNNYAMTTLTGFSGVSIIQPLGGAHIVVQIRSQADLGDDQGNGRHGALNGDFSLTETTCFNEAGAANDGMKAYWISGCARIYGNSEGGRPYKLIGQCDS